MHLSVKSKGGCDKCVSLLKSLGLQEEHLNLLFVCQPFISQLICLCSLLERDELAVFCPVHVCQGG